MNTNQKVWMFFNVKTQIQSHAMPHADAQVFILQLKTHEISYVVAWTPGWQKWVPLQEVLKPNYKFFQLPPPVSETDKEATQISAQIAPTVSETRSGSFNAEKTYTEIQLHNQMPTVQENEFAPEAINWDKTPVKAVLKTGKNGSDDKRAYKRFPHRIEFVLMTKKGKSFRSSSVNVSLGGVLLREAVPVELLADAIDLVVVNPFPDNETPSHLLIKGRVVSDPQDSRRLSFYDISPEVQKKLQFILERYQKNYQQSKKKRAA